MEVSGKIRKRRNGREKVEGRRREMISSFPPVTKRNASFPFLGSSTYGSEVCFPIGSFRFTASFSFQFFFFQCRRPISALPVTT